MDCGILCALADAIWPPFILSTLIGVPSVLLYLLELCTLIRHWKSFNSSFFFLFLMRAIPHLTNYFASFFYLRFGRLGIFMGLMESMSQPLLRLLFFCEFYLFHVENLANFFLLLNRLTSVLFPLNYGKIWRMAIPAAVLITFLSPLSITVYIFQLDIFMSYDEQNRTFTLNYTRPDDYKQWPLIWRKGNVFLTMVSAVSFLVICLLLNLLTIMAMRWQARKIQQNINLERHKMERKMTIYALATFLGQIIIAAYMILQYVIASILKHDSGLEEDLRQQMILATQNHFCWVNDLCTVALPAWLLLWASSGMHKAFLKDWRFFLASRPSSLWQTQKRPTRVDNNITMVERSWHTAVHPALPVRHQSRTRRPFGSTTISSWPADERRSISHPPTETLQANRNNQIKSAGMSRNVWT